MTGWWQDLWLGLQSDWSDFPTIVDAIRFVLRLLMALALGGVLGYEREQSGKAAGLRTHMLVALGAALFVLLPLQQGASLADLSHVMEGIITGIGFIGAGTILKNSDERFVKGLTTAASIWLTAAVGIAVGMGRLSTAVIVTAIAFIVLDLLPYYRPIEGKKESRQEHLVIQSPDWNQSDPE